MSRGTITLPPPTPNSPLNTPAAVPIAPSFSQRPRGMEGHTRGVTTAATLAEQLAPVRADPARSAILLDVDGVLAPIVRHADDATVPEPVRTLLIPVGRRYGVVACVTGRRATDARRIVSIGSISYIGNHGGELLRPGGVRLEVDRALEEWSRRGGGLAPGGEKTPPPPPPAAPGGQAARLALPLPRAAPREA